MSERTKFVDEFVDESRERFQAAFNSVEDEFQKLQERGEKLRNRAEKRWSKLQGEIRKNTVVKRAEEIGNDLRETLEKRSKAIEEQVEHGVETLLGTLQIASRGEIDKLDKKLNKINRKLSAIDKALHDSRQGKAASVQSKPAGQAAAAK